MVDAPDADVPLHDLGAKVREDLRQLRDAAQRQSSELASRWRDFLDREPELAVAAAFGAGFVLSGALVSRLTGRVASAVLRLALRRLLRQAMGGLTEEVAQLFGGAAAATMEPAGTA